MTQRAYCSATAGSATARTQGAWSADTCLFPPASPSRVDGAVLIILTAAELEKCRDTAARLCEANYGRGDAAHYDRDKMRDDYFANTASNVGECAVSKYTGQPWHARVLSVAAHKQKREEGDLVDVGKKEESRVTYKAHAVAIRSTDAGKRVWAVRVPDELNLSQCLLLGWIEADAALASKWMEWEDSGLVPWGYYPLEHLNPPAAYFTR